MTQSMTSHFDGQVIVPDELIELPVGQPLRVVVAVDSTNGLLQRSLATLRGTVAFIAPDFDAPLDDFKDYMD